MKHRYTHTGEKPHACQFCEYKSTQNSNLRRHLAKRHNIDVSNANWGFKKDNDSDNKYAHYSIYSRAFG